MNTPTPTTKEADTKAHPTPTIQVKHRKRVLTALNAPGDTILAHAAKTCQKRAQHPQQQRYQGAPCEQQSAHTAAQPRRINAAPLRLGVSASRVTGRTRILHPPLARLQQIRERVTGSHNTMTHSTPTRRPGEPHPLLRQRTCRGGAPRCRPACSQLAPPCAHMSYCL